MKKVLNMSKKLLWKYTTKPSNDDYIVIEKEDKKVLVVTFLALADLTDFKAPYKKITCYMRITNFNLNIIPWCC